jgi:hypothetical protein
LAVAEGEAGPSAFGKDCLVAPTSDPNQPQLQSQSQSQSQPLSQPEPQTQPQPQTLSHLLPMSQWAFAGDLLGPITAAPPRLLDFSVGGALFVGGQASAEYTYSGGCEGVSEYWWIRITPEGKRVQLSEPETVASASVVVRGVKKLDSADSGDATPSSSSSSSLASSSVETSGDASTASNTDASASTNSTNVTPRRYTIVEQDLGCTLKVKCRPIRIDGSKGEIFTSKSSRKIAQSEEDMLAMLNREEEEEDD